MKGEEHEGMSEGEVGERMGNREEGGRGLNCIPV